MRVQAVCLLIVRKWHSGLIKNLKHVECSSKFRLRTRVVLVVGPIVIVYPQGRFYSMITMDDASEIAEEHFVNGRVVKRLIYKEAIAGNNIKSLN